MLRSRRNLPRKKKLKLILGRFNRKGLYLLVDWGQNPLLREFWLEGLFIQSSRVSTCPGPVPELMALAENY